ncbi:transcriptional regulator [Rhizobium sp. Root708]|uniref:winged helix-turn-helix transcriptional regulator n=1 Tax=Rhizobium sp. Root708 TaxID=1736592 RepID=UPI0006F39CD6|nr:helix-turn-helix domain-containing protein [Rhizobium sp. Root708]KRB58888.1 transcriptional regulator [Rhizobium sp. Root708]
MEELHRSGCPINLTLEILGDRWSLIVIRDIMFGNRRHFRELLQNSQERIASNILADRLRRLVDRGLLTREDDPTHKQKAIYSLTEMAIDLVPLLAQMGAWGRKHLPVSEELSIRAELLENGGQALWNDFMEELRAKHLGKQLPPGTPSVLAGLTKAYLDVLAKKAGCSVLAENDTGAPAGHQGQKYGENAV